MDEDVVDTELVIVLLVVVDACVGNGLPTVAVVVEVEVADTQAVAGQNAVCVGEVHGAAFGVELRGAGAEEPEAVLDEITASFEAWLNLTVVILDGDIELGSVVGAR